MRIRPALLLAVVCLFGKSPALFAAEAGVRPVPPPGVAVSDADRAELKKGLGTLGNETADLLKKLGTDTGKVAEMPNVEIFHKAVDWALNYNEFFDPKQIATAKQLLDEGRARVAAFKSGKTPWNEQPGLVVRAYRSAIDGSVQPYGLVLPDDWKPGEKTPRPLHFWCHGRGETLSELAFIADRMKNKGEFAPPGAIVCHLYGRYCCANKFAGERDLFESLDDIKKHYAIDSARLVIRGFSMGGASTWQFATHFPDMWAAAAPGAGFAETAEFFHVFAPGKTPPPWWEQVLWRWYDSTTMAANLASTKTVAYSGEIDGQKQAADIMVKYAKEEGIEFPHIIGPQTPHKYHPDSKPKIEELVTAAVKEGRKEWPKKVRFTFTTYSLIYSRMELVEVRAMEKEWERADITFEQTGEGVVVTTKNVTAFALHFPRMGNISHASGPGLIVDGQKLQLQAALMVAQIERKHDGKWVAIDSDRGTTGAPPPLAKSPTVCGPIDHAFMSKFLFVEPSSKPLNDTVDAWAKGEMEHAKTFWRKVFRGDAPSKLDTGVTEQDIESSNLILWGDPFSNVLLGKIIAKLPVKWTKDTLEFRGVTYDVAHHAPILIFPNPLNPAHYVVINSGPTFREEALLNNSDQTPKLPDWAIIDLNTPPDAKWPGQVVDAGFFDEQWK